MTDFFIRPATLADAPVIVALLRELAEYERIEGIFHLTEALAVRDLLGPDAAAHCILAVENGEPVGIAVWFWTYKSFRARRGLYLEDLYVRPASRGRGLGRALLAHLAKIAMVSGAGWLEWLVLDWNKPAIDFYRRIDGEPMEGWTTYRLYEDAMRKLT